MYYCPYCGFSLINPTIHGISGCNNCSRVFDTSPLNRMLSAAWLVRRHHIQDRDILVCKYNYSQDEANLLVEYVAQDGYSHEDFLDFLKATGVSEEYQLDVA